MYYRFTDEEYADIVFVYGYCNGNARAAAREYQQRFPHRRHPCHSLFTSCFRRFRTTGCARPTGEGRGMVGNVDAEERILEALRVNPRRSTRRIATELRLSQSFVWRVARNEGLHPYHLQDVQGLQEGDAHRRLEFCRWFLNKNAEDDTFFANTLWTDESTFTRDGITNHHNDHMWAFDNPNGVRPRRFQQRFSINVWGGLWNNTLLPLHHLDGTLTGVSYLQLLEGTLTDHLDGIPVRRLLNMWFQHDGAPAHRANRVTQWLNLNFPRKWIGQGGPNPWPPRSPDLTPCDFYLWGHLKQLVYAENITDRQQLRQRIEDGATHIRNTMDLHLLQANMVRRCQLCIQAGGLHFEHLL